MTNPKYSQKNIEFSMALSRFTHEIRNPLSLVVSELQLLSDLHPEITDYKDWDVILDNLSYMENLLQAFSSYGTAGQISKTPTALREYLLNLIRSVHPTLDYLKISLKTEIPESLPVIYLDQFKLRQTFLNLIRNAQEAVSPENGQITIACQKITDASICLSITDNGCGMSEEQMANIFTPFVSYRSDGTGLGLPISRQIIEAHGGNIEVESSPGHGTCFRIFLGG